MNNITQNSFTSSRKAVHKFAAILGLMTLLLFNAVSFGQNTYTFTGGTFNYQFPPKVTTAKIAAWGAGGAGGGTGTTNGSVRTGGGGGGGAYAALNTFTVSNGTIYSGLGGPAGVGVSTGTGGAGADSYWINNTTLLAKGGSGGGATNNATGGSSGAGGLSSASIGDAGSKFSGGNGAVGSGSATGSGGGGGSAGSTTVGGNGSAPTAGTAGSIGGAAGAAGKTGNGAGGAGVSGGGGGSGSYAAINNTTARAGGDGGAGKIAITYTGYCRPISSLATTYINAFSTAGATTNISTTATGYGAYGYQNQYYATGGSMAINAGSSFTTTFNLVTGFSAGVAIWIDWDNSGTFTIGERVYDSAAYLSSGNVTTASILVPTTQAAGSYVMRIVTDYDATSPDSCNLVNGQGEGEDYQIVVSVPSCSAPTIAATTAITASTATINWTAPSTAPSNGYNYEVRTSGGAGSGATGLAASGSVSAGITTKNVSGLTSATSYSVYVQSNCGAGDLSVWSIAGNFTTSCTTPNNATITSFTVVSATGITLNYTAAAPVPTTYVVFRSTNAVVPSPVNGTVYSSGTTYFTSYKCILNSAALTIADTGLTANTKYYYYVFAQNSTNTCFGAPWYSTGVSSNQITCAAAPTVSVNSAITSSGFTAAWTASAVGGGAGAITYTMEVHSNAGYTALVGSPYTGLTSPTQIVTGLSAATQYWWRVKANNGSCDSTYLNGTTFTTACATISTFPYTEGFESLTVANTLPTCMTASPIVATGGKTQTYIASAIGTNSALIARTGSKFAAVYWSPSATGGYFFSTALQLTGGVTYTSTVYYKTDATAWTDVTLYYGTSATTAAMTNTIATATAAATTYAPVSGTFTPSVSGVYYVAFRAYNATTSPNYCAFDDFSVDVAPLCSSAPASVSATTNITTTTATLNWAAATTPPASGYEYYYSTSSTAPTSGTTASGSVGGVVLTDNISGLTAATLYNVWVRSNCNGTDKSAWTAVSGTFRTACTSPNNATITSFTGVSATGITLNYAAATPVPTTYVVFRSTNPVAPSPVNGTVYVSGTTYFTSYKCILNSSALTIADTGLTGNTKYYYYVFAQNSTNTCFGAPWYSTGVSSNQITCAAAPTAPVNSAITTTSATVSWTASVVGGGAGAINYTLEVYSDAGYTTPISGSPFAVGSPVTFNLSGLTAGSQYYYKVKANNGTCDSIYLTGSLLLPCTNITTFPYSMGFDSSAPCWTISTGTGQWGLTASSIDISAPQSGSGFAYKPYSTSTQYLYSAPMDLLSFGANQAQLNFWIYRHSGTVPADNISFKINTSASNTGATNLQTFPILSSSVPVEVASGWYNYKVVVPTSWNTAGTVYFVIEGVSTAGSSSYDIGLDNFVVEQAPAAITITPSGSTTICSGSSVTLVASSTAGYTYTWSGGLGTGATVIASPTVTTIYTVTGSLSGVDITTQTVTVIVIPAPTAIVLTPTSASVCAGGIQSIAATGGVVSSTGIPVASSGTSAASGASPLYTYYGAARTQVLYTAAELTAAGLVSGSTISSLGLNVTVVGETRTGFNIGYKYISAATLSSNTFLTGATNVYSAPLNPVLGINTYTFSTPTSTWNGTDNIVFEFCFSDNVIGNLSSTVTTVAATSGNTVNAVAADSTTSECSVATGTTSKVRPYIILGSPIQQITWTPITDLYTDSGATTAYSLGAFATTVYVKSATPGTTVYTATATQGSCSKTATSTITVNPNTWTGVTNNLWNVATNWSCGIVPDGTKDVLISTGTPTLDVNYTANSGTTLTINGTGSLTVNPTKILTVAGTAAFNGQPITFESDTDGTAMLGQVTGTITGASNVTVKRYIPQGKRAFRFLTPGVTTTNFIAANWQQATHITGGITGNTGGFDVTTTGNPSMYTYSNQVASGTGWTAIPNTNATNLVAGTGYRMLIRGDRTPTLLTTASQQNMNAAITLSATGTLVTGTVVLDALSTPAINDTTNATTAGFSLVGNPYVSPIDWEALGKSGLEDAYYGFEPNFGTGTTRGKYVVYSTVSHTNNESTSNIGQYIQSGQAFMVKNTVLGTAGELTFNESNKASTQASVFKSANTQNLTTTNAVLRLSVYDPNELALASYPIDGTVAVFGSDFTNDYGYGDVVKLLSTGENLGLFKESKTLAIEALAPVQNNDELLVKTTQFQANKSYTFKVSTQDFSADVTAYLVDQYLNTQSTINMEAQTFATFTTSTDVNSYGADRFKIVFSNTALGNDSFARNAMVVYPNPVTDNTFNISVPSNVTGAIQVTVYNLVGQEMYRTTEQAQQTVTIRPNRVLAQGVYIVQITNDGKTTNSKITIQ